MFNLVWLRDMGERVVATFVMAFGPSLIALGWDGWQTALGIGGMAALGSFVKSVAGTQVGNPESASILPTKEP